ncbi:hypothetical protein A3I48_04270 [Candidatus Daviesbacteria bacterium RIFCSPLOWO2_02_FULL_36_7]|uniref:Bacterial Ig-like domain-containing protein n=1 Tax=Candidatus Daviesbacteria bacterium RIFCSPLOWO2_02_FULL_36_7 TaxID=1797792 RepID=A0A1F5MHX1_9BACT|nr:MAG: hypothetical protein A3I48_04270 [Candidatus Daviesbacteria bacterium RIFCSPLOWO2_02_FULL_36_7]
MKLGKKLTTKHFIIAHALILITALIFLAGLYYILNIQYRQPAKDSFSNGPVTTPPKTLRLDLDQPDQDSLSYSASIIVSGRTGPGKDVLISTETNDLVIRSKPDGSFSTILDLDEGVNNITAAVFDTTGDSKSAERTVYYSKEKL